MLLDAFWIILTGALVAGSAAVLGSFLVLRRMAMLGDAISHAVLPGVVVAFLISGSRASLYMFLGAVAIGLLTAFLVQLLSRKGVRSDAAMGVSFTSLFALGVLFVSLWGGNIDLDLDCVLYGEIAYTPFDSLVLGGVDIGPRPVWINAALFALNLLLVSLFWKQFKLCAFDPGMAAAVGISVAANHYLLMGLVSVTVVGAFESVGAILVVALLVVPPAAAYLLSDRLEAMIAIAVGIGAASSALGYLIAISIDASIAGSIALVCGLFFIAAFLFSPLHGIVPKLLTRRSLSYQVKNEHALLWAARRLEAGEGVTFALADLRDGIRAGDAAARTVLARLRRAGEVEAREGGYGLSTSGLEAASVLLRRHRLYESYLDEIGYPADHIHEPADRVEHFIPPTVVERLEEEVGDRESDPHGKPIPGC